MLPNQTFFLRFTHRDCFEIEEQEYTCLTEAMNALRLFLDEDGVEMYSRLEVIGHDWQNHKDTLIAEAVLDALAFKSSNHIPRV